MNRNYFVSSPFSASLSELSLCFKSAHFNRVLIVSLVCLSSESFLFSLNSLNYYWALLIFIVIVRCSLFVVCSCLTCMCYLPIIIIVCYDYYRIAPDEYSTLSANKKQKSKRNNVEIEIMSKSSASELSARKKSK